jgi:protein TonB
MTTPYETTTPNDRLSLRRILAYSGALAVHLGLFAFLMAPVSHEAAAATELPKVQITFYTPEPPPPPPPPIPAPPPVPVRHAPPPRPNTPPPPQPIDKNDMVELVKELDTGPANNDPVIPVEPPSTGPITAKSGELSIVRGRLAYNAKIRNLAGRVELRILVGTDGRPVEILIEKSSGEPRLDQEAKRQARDWVFTAAVRNGEKVMAWAVVPIVFQLEQG